MSERKMTEVADPNAGKVERLFAKFTQIGDFVEGHFAKISIQKGVGCWDDGRKKQDQNVFEFIDETGGVVAVNASADIEAKMGLVAIGTFTRIEYAMDRVLKGKDKPMKIFKISTDASDRWSEAKISQTYAALEAAAKAAADATGKAPF